MIQLVLGAKNAEPVSSRSSARGLISTCLAAGYRVCKTVAVTMGRQRQIILTTGSARLWWWQWAGNIKLYLLRGLQGCDGDKGQAMSNYTYYGVCKAVMVTMGRQCQIILLQGLQDCDGNNGQAMSNYTYYGVCKTVAVTICRQCHIILTTGSARLWRWQYAGNVKLYLRPFPASAADLPQSTASLWHQGTSSQMPLGISANKMVQWASHTTQTYTFSLSFAATQQHLCLQFALKCTRGSKAYCL